MISMLTSIFPATSADASRRVFSPSQKRSTLVALCAVLLFTILGQAQQSPQVLHHHLRPAISSGQAALVGPALATQKMKLTIVLPLRNQGRLTALLGQLYAPSSPNYHHFLSVDQFTEKFSPTAEDYQAVVDFAQANGFTVTDRPANRLIVPISGTVAQVEKTFNVRMNNYQHPTEKRTFFSPDREPSLDLKVAVAHIAGLNNFSIPRSMATKATNTQGSATAAAVGSGPGGAYLASDMRTAYYGGTALSGSGQTVGLVEFDGYNISDVVSSFDGTATSSANESNYLLAYTPTAGGTTYNIPINNVLLDGTTGAPVSGADAEETLDIVQAIGMAPGLSQVRVYIGSNDADILNAMASENIAQQLSISWGWSSDDPSTDDFIFQEMAAQGQSVFAASGDYGAYNPEEFVIGAAYFYPAEDVWVTTVGGTSMTTNGAGGSWASETAWNRSGGGISPDGIPIPSWQAGVVNSSNGGSTTLRNVPDVAAEADFDNYDCDMGVCQGTWAGTSFAAPRWAGFMALVNQQAVAAGQSTVGFVNPAIYAIGEGSSYDSDFHDITSGNNNAFYQTVIYNAVSGYDLVTGWGTPAGENLINALAPPASVGFQLSASPSSLTINPGASGTTTITVQDVGGFSGSVNLSISGLPSGVNASFGTNPATGSTVLTLTVSSSAIRGSYLLTITGAAGSVTTTTSLALLVNAPGFSIGSNPGSMQISLGSSSSSTISVTDYAGFTGSVTLAVTAGLPSGVTASWVTNPTSGSSLLALTASTFATPNNYVVVTITGTSGALSATTTIALALFRENYDINVSPYPYTLAQGGSATATVTVTPDGNYPVGSAGSVILSAVNLSSGVSASFNPNPTTTGTSVVTMTASNSATLGTSEIYIVANSPGILSTEVEFQQTITATPTPTFTVATSSPSLTVAQGGSVTNTVTVTDLNGFTGTVTLAGNAPLGATVSITPNPTTGTSLLTLNASSSTAAGVYWCSVTGTSGTLSVYATYWLIVTPPPSFTISASPTSLTLEQGSSATSAITITPLTGFTGNVTFAAPNLPNGLTASFAPNPTTGTSVLTLNANSSVTPGNYTVIVTGTSGAQTVTTTLALTINAVDITAPSPGNFGAVNVGTTSPVIPLVFTFDTAGMFGSTAVLTQGATALDFADAGTGSCTANTAYTAGQTCTVNVTFTPSFAGPHYGVVELLDSFGDVFATGYLEGTGVGPQVNFLPGTQSTLGSGFSDPMAVAVDSSGNVFVADWGSYAVKEILAVNGSIPASPTITTLASGFDSPWGVAVDGGGNVFVADHSKNVVYEIVKAGGYLTVNSLGGGFSAPWGLAVDGSGNVFVADYGNSAVKEIPPGCVDSACVITLGSGFSEPVGVAVDGNGNLFVTDTNDSTGITAVKEILATGGYTTINTLASGLSGSTGVTVDAAGNLFIANTASYTVLEIAAAGGYATVNWLAGSFLAPYGMALDQAGNLYVADTGNNRVEKLDFADAPSLSFASTAVGSTSNDSPQTVTVENVGNAALNFSAVSYPSSFPESSQETTDCAATTSLPASGSCTLTINFTPLAAGARSGSLVLTDNALNDVPATQSISLSGTATPAPSFTLSASPSSLTVVQGNSGTSTIAVTGQNGFTDSVTLAASGLPSGVTAAFGTNPTTGSSVLTLTASGTAATGTATVMIEGTSGSLTASTTVALTVNPAPSFTLGASPSSLTVVQGTSGTPTIAVTGQNGFTGSVTLAATGLPNGVTAGFATNPTTGSSVLTLTASSTATVGTATVTITGTSGSLTASTTVALTINPAPSFTLSDSPGSLTVVQGKSGTSTIAVTAVNGFTGSVTLAASGLPSGVTAAFATNPATGSSVLTLTASSTATVGTATITIKGTSGSLTATTTLSLTIPAPSFTLTDSPGSLTVVQGKSGTSTIAVTAVNGFTGSVTLAASGLPSGVTAAFGTNPTTGSSVLTLTASSTATVGTATITIKGTSGSLTATTTLSLTVTAAPSFTISASPASLTIVRGKTGTSTITITSQNSFSSATTLSATGLPKGVTASFSANPVTPKANGSATSTLTLTASSSATTGAVTVTMTGVSGSLTQNTTIALTVNK